MKMCEFVGGAYIYAECVKTGIGKLVWDSHPIQETNMGNFIYLQLALSGKISCFVSTGKTAMGSVAGWSGFEGLAGLVEQTQIRTCPTSPGAASKPLPRAEVRIVVLASK